MRGAPKTTHPNALGIQCAEPAASGGASRWPLAFVLVLAGIATLPGVRENPRLLASFFGAALALLAWFELLRRHARRSGRKLAVEYARPLKAHYVQACVQICIYAYWAAYWPKVVQAAPLILGQLAFLFAFDGLLTWSRGRAWRFGMGPVPIVLSTNLFMWFKDDWFFLQFALIASCALAKEFLRWKRDGRSTHIFNPSAFGLALCSIVLITTGTTHVTWGLEVATTLGMPPHMYLLIFGLGLVVQYLFSVTLMTLSAVGTLALLDVLYHQSTGVYQFVDTNIPVAIFLGMHLLMTDPATSPRTGVGRVIFGAAYGVANFVLFTVLGGFGVPDFYDKLLPVPILNLCVPMLDRLGHSGFIEKCARFAAGWQPKRLNYAHMGAWVALFAVMYSTGFVAGPHEGASVEFWRKAYAEGKPDAGRKWMKLVGSLAEGDNAAACNQLGVMHLEGKVAELDRAKAAFYFSKACALGSVKGCENAVARVVFPTPGVESAAVPPQVFETLEARLEQSTDGRAAFLLGLAYETGRGRPAKAERALELYARGCDLGHAGAAKGLVRVAFASGSTRDLAPAARLLTAAAEKGEAESCLYLANMHHAGRGVVHDEQRASELLENACRLGSREACDALGRPQRWSVLAPAAK